MFTNISLAGAISLLLLFPTKEADQILGTYWSPTKNGKIEVYRRDSRYYGKFVWSAHPRQDTENPDPALRDRELLGLEFLKDFAFNGDDTWESGTIYDPESGKTYQCTMWLEESGQELKVRGYVGISLFGRTETFVRVQNE